MLARDIVDQVMANAMHAMQVTVAITLYSIPGALTCSHDMFLNVPLIANWQTTSQCHKKFVDDSIYHVNRK